MSGFTIKGRLVRGGVAEEGFLFVEDGKIMDAVRHDRSRGKYIDTGDCYIVPGFIDLHIHGIHRSLVDNGSEDLREICRILPRYGVTGFLPTIAPRTVGEDARFVRGLSQTGTEGAAVLGFHLEGPFLKISGALPSEAVSGADAARVEALIEAASPHKVVFSVSPDVEGIAELIPLMARGDTPVFITHTAATVRQTQIAIESGASHATHFYDVFPCPPVAEPGVRPCGAVEAILADARVSVDFILDGVHVDPVAVKMALACKSGGEGRVCLITDANIGAGLEPERFGFGGGEIYFDSMGAPARSVQDGTLAGSGLTMDAALRNAVEWLGLDLPAAVSLCSANPAKVLGLGHRKGALEAGFDADFTVLNDRLEVVQTWINGKCYFKSL